MTRRLAWAGVSVVALVVACGSTADPNGGAATGGASGAGASGKASGGSAGKSGSSGNAAAGSKAAGNAGAPNAGAAGAAGNTPAGAAGNTSAGNGQGGGGAGSGGAATSGGNAGAGAAGKGGAGAGGAASGAGGTAGQGGAAQGGKAGAGASASAAGGPASGAAGTGGASAGSSGASGQQSAGAAGLAGAAGTGGGAGTGGSAGTGGGGAGQAGGAAVCGVVGACTLPGTRDAAYWPFDPCSPWNHPIGDGAVYEAPTSSDLSTDLSDPTAQLWLNWDQYSHPIYVASASDPVRTISAPELTVQTEVPNGVAPSAGSDGHLHVVDPTHHWVIETYQATVKPNGDIFASDDAKNDLFGLGVFGVEKYGGTRAYGGSSIGGIIRKDRGGGAWDEMAMGIRHALSAAVRRTAMNKTTPNGKGYVWPASYRDDGWQTTYGASGNVHMGSLLAIPKSVDLATLGLKNAGVKAVARALQDYGAYIVDATSDNLNFAAEPWVPSAGSANDSGELRLLLPHVRVVVNNDPSHVGGGGTPLACFAPPL